MTPWITAHQASLSITKSQSPPKPMSIESVMPSNQLILCCPLLLLPSIFPRIRVFSNESALHQVAKISEFQLQQCLSSEHPGLISFRIDWFDLLAVQGTLLQHHSSKASILWCSASLWSTSHIHTVQFSRSVMSNSLRPHVQCSTPGLPVHHQIPEFTQTHAHQVGGAIQPSHPLSSTGVQPQQDPGVPSGWTALAKREREKE